MPVRGFAPVLGGPSLFTPMLRGWVWEAAVRSDLSAHHTEQAPIPKAEASLRTPVLPILSHCDGVKLQSPYLSKKT